MHIDINAMLRVSFCTPAESMEVVMVQPQVLLEVLRVSHMSRPSAVAGAIAGVMRDRSQVEIQAVGAGAVNQAIKAIAVARSYLVDDGIAIGCVPFFIDLVIGGEERTGIRFLVEHMEPPEASEQAAPLSTPKT